MYKRAEYQVISNRLKEPRKSIHTPKQDTQHLHPYTIEELRCGIEQSERQYTAGDFYTQEQAHELMKQFVQ